MLFILSSVKQKVRGSRVGFFQVQIYLKLKEFASISNCYTLKPLIVFSMKFSQRLNGREDPFLYFNTILWDKN